MLKKISAIHGLCGICVIGLAAIVGCDSSSDNGAAKPVPPAKPIGNVTKPADKLPADAPATDALIGTWVGDDNDTFIWRFTADGYFVVRSLDKSDLTQFPKNLRNKVDSFMGRWTIADSEIRLAEISGPGQKLVDEVKISYRKIDNNKFEIDGAKFNRGDVDSLTPNADADDDDDNADSD